MGEWIGLNWTGVDSNSRCDKTRQDSFFFPNEKERKFARKGGGGEKEMGGGGCWREMVFDLFFKGIINSLSAIVMYSIYPLLSDGSTRELST